MPLRDAFADLLLGGCCAGCGAPGRVLCAACVRLLPTGAGEARPDPAPVGLPRVFAAGEYADPLRRLVLAHKEQRAFALARPLGALLADACAAALTDLLPTDSPVGSPAGARVVLVPVPSSPAATRRRGHDPVLRMTRVAAGWERRDLPVGVARLLRVARPVADQAGLDAAARAANLAGRLAVRSEAHRALARSGPALVLLCDDVVTTGATLSEAARALRAVGIVPAAALAVAATRRRRPGTGVL